MRSLFLRALGGVWFAAFTSLGAQVLGLYGKRGILPVRELLDAADSTLGKQRARRHYPSLFWLSASDRALVGACRAGQAASLLLMAGVAPRSTLFACWALYGSFVITGRDFLSFQWDILLLETTAHAFVIAGPKDESPPWHSVLLMRWLSARFFYEAGVAKVDSHDPTWSTLTACYYHYETQPLPTLPGWYAHQLPRRAQRLSTALALDIEQYAPFLTLEPRRRRLLGFPLLAGLQAGIALTGNYGFFNPLSIALALFALDDRALPGRARKSRKTGPVRSVLMAIGEGLLFAAGLATHLQRYTDARVPRPLAAIADKLSELRSMASYGLFASMTTERREIAIEGSDDGEHWSEYRFRYKPNDERDAPKFVAPHMPRLDWQMWFAALSPPPRWFSRFLQRVLEGSPDVLGLFERVPFEHPPRFVRAVVYDQRFTDIETREKTGEYWKRKRLGLYFPPVTLRHAAA
ncbi:MAG: lipase maturation factor family protein [Polyangiales bacterium]